MSMPRTVSLHPYAIALSLGLLASVAACGGDAPPAAKAPAKAIAPVEPPVDTSALPEPNGLVVMARISKPDAVLKTVGGWTHLPLPGAADLVRSLSDDDVADSVDTSQPIDAAAALGGSRRDPRPLVAVSIAVKSYDDAKAKLSAKHKVTAGKNGQLLIDGVGGAPSGAQGKGPRDEDSDDDSASCVLAHAPTGPTGGRLVCGEREALDALAPFMSRTMPRQQWPSDMHAEITLAALKEPLSQLRASLPFLARSLLGTSSPAAGKVVEATVNEMADIVNDTGRITIDAQVADAGLDATMKIDFVKANSLVAKLATSHPERAEAPPPSFMHLPAETDLALYGKGSDPALFDHMRDLLGNMALEVTEGVQMPEQERKAVRELVIDRMLALFTGPLVYGKGFDSVALDKAIAARGGVKANDVAAEDEADRIIAEQMIGWHLVQVNDPISKVGPMLKDWAALWNKPEFAKWAKQQSSGRMLAQMRTGALPAGATLPKDSVHLEIVIPRPDVEEPVAAAPMAPGAKAPGGKAPAAKPKKVAVKPLVLHVLAVPDQGGTWVGFAMDAKLLAQKAATALSTAPDAATLGKTATADAVKGVKANGAVLVTLKGLLVFTALGHRRSSYGLLGALTNKGQTPALLTFAAQPPSGDGAGSSITKFLIPRGAIEDSVKVAISSAR